MDRSDEVILVKDPTRNGVIIETEDVTEDGVSKTKFQVYWYTGGDPSWHYKPELRVVPRRGGNHVHGKVTGTLIQARDIQGGVFLDRDR